MIYFLLVTAKVFPVLKRSQPKVFFFLLGRVGGGGGGEGFNYPSGCLKKKASLVRSHLGKVISGL